MRNCHWKALEISTYLRDGAQSNLETMCLGVGLGIALRAASTNPSTLDNGMAIFGKRLLSKVLQIDPSDFKGAMHIR